MQNTAEPLSRAEHLLRVGKIREAWQQLEYMKANYPHEIGCTLPLELEIERAAKPMDRIGRVAFATWPNWSCAAVSCTFDDRLTSHVDIVRADLDRYGFPGTFFVIRDPASQPPLSVEYLSKWRALGQSQHEIGNHTADHLKSLPSLAPAEIEQQIKRCDEFIERHLGLAPAKSFSYPFGAHGPPDGYLRSYVRRRFAVARTTHSKPCGINPATPECMDVLQSFSVNRRYSLEQVQQQLDQAVATRGWAILTFHRVAQGEGAEKIDRSFWIVCLNSIAARRERLWIATLESVSAYIAARQSVRIVCRSATEAALSFSMDNPPLPISDTAISASVRLPKSWRIARKLDTDGSAFDYRVRDGTIRISVRADERPFLITKLRQRVLAMKEIHIHLHLDREL